MPELPEVHTTATMLNKILKGLRITSVWTSYNSPSHKGKDNIKNPEFFKIFSKKITGAEFKKGYRRGKNVLLELDNGYTVIIHMKMTGHLLYGKYKKVKSKNLKERSKEKWETVEEGPLKDSKNQFIRFVMSLSDGRHLVLSDMRKFAKVTIEKTTELETSKHIGGIGPEPLETTFNLKLFTERLMLRPRSKIKQVLMNPEIIAGIGNIYSDEALFLAGIHPESRVNEIPSEKMSELFKAVKKVLTKGIDFGGDSTSDYRNPLGVHGNFHHHHQAYRNTGKPCAQKGCSGTIRKVKIGGRSAHFCDKHQILYS
jgi:formamidopyrimidine-DNA glycosylase